MIVADFIHGSPHARVVLLGLWDHWQPFFFEEALHFRAESEVFGLAEVLVVVSVGLGKVTLERLNHCRPLRRLRKFLLCSLCLGIDFVAPLQHFD